MTAAELSELFLAWWQARYPEGRIYRNNTGIATFRRGKVAYGIPPPKGGRGKGGGGTDYISFRSYPAMEGAIICAEFWEIKTLKDVFSKRQKDFYRVITNMGGKINIVQELPDGQWEVQEWKDS